MPYLGNTAGNRFVASKAASVYSGDGSTTAFTLEHAVGSDEDILVSVDGVIQEPSVAYAVSNGTTLTFTAAPSSNSGNNIFVYYLFRTVATVDHPSTSSLQATDGTFSAGVTATTGTFSGAVSAASLDADGGVTVDNITIDGQEIDVSSGDLTLDVAGDIILDADGAEIKLKDGGTQFANLYTSSSNFYIQSSIQDKDIIFQGDNGGTGITALTLDMSEGGAATFAKGITLTDGDLVLASGHGISFAATGGPTNGTGSNEILSDYEEGTFTGGLDQYAGTPTINTAVYTKVGRLVTASINIALDGTSDASGFIINSLPFASLSTATSSQGGFISYTNTSHTNPIRVLVSGGTAKSYLYKQDGTTLTYNDFGNDRNIRITFVYFT